RHTRFSRDWSSDVCSSDLNEKGGFEVAGETYLIELKQYDDQSNPQVGVSGAERLINEDKAKVIFLSPSSTSALAEATVTERNKEIGRASCRDTRHRPSDPS